MVSLGIAGSHNVRLRRAKSTSSVPKVPFSYPFAVEDPDTTRRNAITAAVRAFERSSRVNKDDAGPNTNTQLLGRRNGKFGRRTYLARRKSWQTGNGNASMSHKWLQGNRDLRTRVSDGQFASASMSTPGRSSMDQTPPHFYGYAATSHRPVSSRLIGRSRLQRTKSALSQGTVRDSTQSVRHFMVPVPDSEEHKSEGGLISVARDRYLKAHQRRSIGKRSSTLSHHSFLIDGEKTNPEGGHGNTSEDYNHVTIMPIISQHVSEVSTNPKPSKAFRGFSASLSSFKKSFRRVFPKHNKRYSVIPEQHISSTKIHYGKTSGYSLLEDPVSLPGPSLDIGPIPMPDVQTSEESCTRNESAFHEREQDYESFPATVLRGAMEESRVTSWNDTSRQNTLISFDAKDFSKIEETGLTSRSRASDRSRNILKRLSLPLRKSSYNIQEKARTDGHRIVSALRRHVHAYPEEDNEVATGVSPHNGGNSTRYLPADPFTTIRTVTPEPLPDDSLSSTNSSIVPKAVHHFEKIPDLDQGKRWGAKHAFRNVVSPSVYSERASFDFVADENNSSSELSWCAAGTANVSPSKAVSKWSIGVDTTDQKRITSNEWRSWASNEFAGLGTRISSDLTKPFSGYHGDFATKSFLQAERLDDTATSEGLQKCTIRGDNIELRGQHTVEGEGQSLFDSRFCARKSLFSNDLIAPMIGPLTAEGEAEGVSSSNKFDPGAKEFDRNRLTSSRSGTESEKDTGNKSYLHKAQDRDHSLLLNRNIDGAAASGRKILGTSGLPNTHAPRRPPLQSSLNRSNEPRRRFTQLDENFLLRIRKGPYAISSSSLVPGRESTESSRNHEVRTPSENTSNQENQPPHMRYHSLNYPWTYNTQSTIDTTSDGSPAFL